MLHRDALHHALPRLHLHPHCWMEDDKANGSRNVLFLWNIRSLLTGTDLSVGLLPTTDLRTENRELALESRNWTLEFHLSDGRCYVRFLRCLCYLLAGADLWLGGLPSADMNPVPRPRAPPRPPPELAGGAEGWKL